MSRISQQSALRKISDTGFVWQKRDGAYGFTDIATRTDSLVIFALAYGLADHFFPNYTRSELKKYLQLMGLPDTEGVDIVGENSCFKNVEATLFVRSFTKKDWEEEKFYKVSMTNLVTNNCSYQEKLNSFKNIGIRCGCSRGILQPSCRPPEYQREMFKDYRSANHVPGPFIETVYCAHADVAHDWLSIFCDVYGFGMHLPSSTYRVIGYVVKQIIEKNQKLPKYRLNLEFSPEKIEIFKPLLDLTRGYISPE